MQLPPCPSYPWCMTTGLTPHDLVHLLWAGRDLQYDGEPVTQLQHAWQCGQLALQAKASPALQLAAWLHDIGHLATGQLDTPTLLGVDDGHQHLGSRLLAECFGQAVSQPVALHVDAKRYLVATHPDYLRKLSDDSIRSLQLQGGPLTAAESTQFLLLPWAADAVRLRAWDDAAKQTQWRPPSWEAALAQLAALIKNLPIAA